VQGQVTTSYAAGCIVNTIQVLNKTVKIGMGSLDQTLRDLRLNFDVLTGGADKSLDRPTCQCILFDGENISFDASLVIHINSTIIPPIMIINRIHENQNLLSRSLFPSWSG